MSLAHKLIAAIAISLVAVPAFAQTVVAAPATIDLTAVAITVATGILSVVGAVCTAYINARLKNAQDAAVADKAIANSLGALQQAASGVITGYSPHVQIPGVPADLVVPVQYALDHAGPELARLGITPAAVADKINARIGLANIASNVATASSPGPSPAPLAPVVPAVA